MVSQPQFYVYILARPNGKPFYVGKGKDSRVFWHEREAKRGCKCHKCNVIRKIWRNGGEVQRYIVFTTSNEKEALDYECELIVLHGRKNLCNQTDGGDGTSNLEESVRLKKSEGSKRAYSNPELRERCAERMRKQWQDPEYRARQKAGCIRAANSPETKKRQSISQAKRTDDKGSKQMKRYYENPENRKKASERMKRYYENPENRKKASERMRKRKEQHHGEE